MADVTAAAEKCAGGFTASSKGEKQKSTKVAPGKASGSGDESEAFVVTGDAEGDPLTVHVEVARHGSTIASYFSYNLAAMAGGKDKDGSVPAEVVERQTATLDRARPAAGPGPGTRSGPVRGRPVPMTAREPARVGHSLSMSRLSRAVMAIVRPSSAK